ncbi:MAG: S-methyl-5-thioribose-1-phosphate isomerase [Candidatus Margulisbacteria bacterium]|nr:S-methyl-5-thioribose-1-phosphate isomerase [Candidatus Margulisiibacteriota bacterium]MBU1617372.1 S-methyl-5-thioribose-1-phosphate isomerase [Candidatus Margulisiibacteriota bacterium]MBU1867548.1 S-methyl-5-thioribose-1-phosphate isomerase [Candidatus Margulisiibacteriota bacterium]
MKVNGQHYRTVWLEGATVQLIEQNLLPFNFKIHQAPTSADTCHAIKTMIVRGAGAIGAAAGFAMAQVLLEAPQGNWAVIDQGKKMIESTRPTAQNLFFAVDRVYEAAKKGGEPVKAGVAEAQKIADEDAENCRLIGEHGSQLIKDGMNIETHCNAGWLAFVDYGSALSPIYAAHRAGKKVFVFADETRPRGQGARLTAWELKSENIPHAIIPDNAGAYLMSHGKIDLMIVGADRIAANGDTANKIGTLEKAICAKEYGVPFYIAAPTSTFDLKCRDGGDIPIEERSEEEVLCQTGPDEQGVLRRILVCSPGSKAVNPAFDVTPAKFITGIITEKGIVKPNEEAIKRLFL